MGRCAENAPSCLRGSRALILPHPRPPATRVACTRLAAPHRTTRTHLVRLRLRIRIRIRVRDRVRVGDRVRLGLRLRLELRLGLRLRLAYP